MFRSLKIFAPAMVRGVTIAALLVTSQLSAQQATGRIAGRVVDAATGTGIPEASILVAGTTIGVQTTVDGSYNLARVPAGTVTLEVRRIGFGAKTITGIVLGAGRSVEQSISLSSVVTQMSTTVITATQEQGTVAAALDVQRSAVSVVSSVTAEQISRSPDGNAGQAVQRVSGVTVQDGKYVFVRGLGERYTTSSLNGARVPSPEPEKRVVPLDMFPAGLLQTVTTAKTFTPDQPGDFSGAVVDIKTKEFPANRTMTLQLGSGYAAGATGLRLLSAATAGGENFAMVNHGRDLPPVLRNITDFQHITLTQGDMNILVGSLRNAWSPTGGTAAPLMNGSASLGGNDAVLGHSIGYLVSGSISSGTDAVDGQVRALADRGTAPGSTVEMDRFTGTTVTQSVLWGGLANLSTEIGSASKISFNGLLNRSADNSARVETGRFTTDAADAKITRMQYVQRGIYSAQMSGEHQIGDLQHVEWAATTSGVRRFEPDRSEFVQVYEQDTPGGPTTLRWQNGGSGGAVRTFADLTERNHEYRASYQLKLGSDVSATSIKVGGLRRTTGRNAESISYNVSANGASNTIRELPAEQLFDGRFTGAADSVFALGPLSQGGSYVARERLNAAFAMADVPIGAAFRVIGGARYEADRLEVDAFSTLGSPVLTTKVWNDLLPSIALNVRFSDTQQLRVSGSRTLARPEYRELSPIISRDVIGGENLRGDESLSRTRVTNVDVRWELYPTSDEIVSVALFAKRFIDPIERVYGSGSGGTSFVFFTNAKSADNAGIELELRKNLDFLGGVFTPVSFFGNATFMHSQIHLADSTQAAATNLSRRMVGQAPYVLNTGLAYTADGGTSATLLFNRVGERITAAGSSPLPDVIEQPRNVVDLSVRVPVLPAVTARFDAKNLLDSAHDVVQGTVTREYSRAGRTFQIAFQWRPE